LYSARRTESIPKELDFNILIVRELAWPMDWIEWRLNEPVPGV
jgi:hypothetical protein